MRNAVVLFLIALVALIAGCRDCPIEGKEEAQRIERVARIFMHDLTKYSLLVEDAENSGRFNFMVFGWIETDSTPMPTLIADVPRGESMWALAKNDGVNSCCIKEIHIHSPKDLVGAGWVQKTDDSTITGQTVEVE